MLENVIFFLVEVNLQLLTGTICSNETLPEVHFLLIQFPPKYSRTAHAGQAFGKALSSCCCAFSPL